jgi:LysR family glycine cleavage system transcriptional activator
MLETARVKAFRNWVFEEVGRFKLLFEQACQTGPEVGANQALDALRIQP